MSEIGLEVFSTNTDGTYEREKMFVYALHGDRVKTRSKKGIRGPEIFSQMTFQMRES